MSDSKLRLEHIGTYFDTRSRDLFCGQLGFATYQDYLVSDLWRHVTGNLFQCDEHKRCIVCASKTGLAWHHRTYAMPVLVGNFASCSNPIVRMCNDCHKAIHYSEGEFVQCPELTDLALARLCIKWDDGDRTRKRLHSPSLSSISEFQEFSTFPSEEYFGDY